jgi:hypothetical protein
MSLHVYRKDLATRPVKPVDLEVIFKNYLETELAFSEAKLEEVRDEPLEDMIYRYPNRRYIEEHILNDEIPTDAAVIDNEIHPLFQPSNFKTN